MEVSQKSCTSLPCVWSRPKQLGSSIVARDLNFGRASFDGYKDISKPLPPVLGDRDLLKVCDEAWFVTGAHSTLTQQTDTTSAGALVTWANFHWHYRRWNNYIIRGLVVRVLQAFWWPWSMNDVLPSYVSKNLRTKERQLVTSCPYLHCFCVLAWHLHHTQLSHSSLIWPSLGPASVQHGG